MMIHTLYILHAELIDPLKLIDVLHEPSIIKPLLRFSIWSKGAIL